MFVLTLFAGFLLSSRCAVSAETNVLPYRLLGKINIPHPAFVRVLPCGLFTATPSLWITEFSALESGKVYVIDNITHYYPDFADAKYVQVPNTKLKWPNKISTAPEELGDFIVVPDGFLIPWKESGGIYLVPANCSGKMKENGPTATSPIKVTPTNLLSFYHMGQWRDMNNDGKLDLVTARASVNPLEGKKGKGELVWFEQPSSDPLTSVPWKEHVIVQGPDILFQLADFNTSDECFHVFATEFFAEKLTVYSVSKKNASVVASQVIDDKIGPAYCVTFADLNMDGKTELLVTNHLDGAGGEVYAYEIPDDPIVGQYTRHTLASNFTVTESGKNQAAPGFAFAINPSASYSGKPYILVAGDGAQKAYLLYPTDADFAYNTTVVVSVNGVVGFVGFTSITGSDEWTEFFVPDYDDGVLYAYTFAP